MKKTSKILISSIITFAILGISCFIYNWYQKETSYEEMLQQADAYMQNEDYDEAEKLYNESLNTKKTAAVQNKIELIKNRKEVEKALKDADELINSNKIDDALNLLHSLPAIPDNLDDKVSTDLNKITNITDSLLEKQKNATDEFAKGVDDFNQFKNDVNEIKGEVHSNLSNLKTLLDKYKK